MEYIETVWTLDVEQVKTIKRLSSNQITKGLIRLKYNLLTGGLFIFIFNFSPYDGWVCMHDNLRKSPNLSGRHYAPQIKSFN